MTKFRDGAWWLLTLLLRDIVFALFIASQEVNDTSYLHAMAMEARFERSTIVKGAIVAHLVLNFVCICISCLYSGFFLTQDDGNVIGSIAIYFICAYEVLFHVMKWVDVYFDLKTVGN
jgi:putative Ca2+/H+ antiporter (TMEM165/GDT1 family)